VWYLNTATQGVASFPYGLPGWLPVSGLFVLPTSAQASVAKSALATNQANLLTTPELQNAETSALNLLSQAGVNSALLGQLSVTPFAVANLPVGVLAEAQAGQVLLSSDGGGLGWFLDSTLASDQQFIVGAPGSPLVALAGGPAAGKEDLRSAVLQVMGTLAEDGSGDLTTTELPAGQRQTDLIDTLFSRWM
jgi:hypothetical protein